MSEMSQAQGPVGGGVDPDPTDDMVPPGAQSGSDPDAPQDRSEFDGSEDVLPQDYGSEDVGLKISALRTLLSRPILQEFRCRGPARKVRPRRNPPQIRCRTSPGKVSPSSYIAAFAAQHLGSPALASHLCAYGRCDLLGEARKLIITLSPEQERVEAVPHRQVGQLIDPLINWTA